MNIINLRQEVQTHLQEVLDSPSTALNEKLLESVDSRVSEVIEPASRQNLLDQLSQLLPILQQDPTPAASLIDRLISPQRYDFTQVLSINPPVDFLAGLLSPLPPINITTLNLLKKATQKISDVGIVAGKADVVGALIQLWLRTPDTAVAVCAHEAILGFLMAEEVDESSDNIGTETLMWRRIFRDREIYGSIFSTCSLSNVGQKGQLSKRDKTVAQARLLDMLLKIDSRPTRTSQIREIESQYGVEDGGLLHFAAIHMIDYRDDVLMHITLIEFFTSLLEPKHTARPIDDGDQATSFTLEFLRKHGLHKRSMAYYLEPSQHDALDLTYLYGASAKYISTYCSTYPQDLYEANVSRSILLRLTEVLQNISPGHWSQGTVPKHDLYVLASVPRIILLTSPSEDLPFFMIPIQPASADAFNTLALIFHGSEDKTRNAGRIIENAYSMKLERAAARALFLIYTTGYPEFWTRIVNAADTIALKDTALSAISLIGAIITALWDPLPSTYPSYLPPNLPTESQLIEDGFIGGPSPLSGIEAIMTEPAIGIVLPYLMKPAQTFSNLVGGGRGDVESAAYQVAVAKHDVLSLLHRALNDWVGKHPDAQDMVATVARRVAQGPMGGTSEIGGRVGTLEL